MLFGYPPLPLALNGVTQSLATTDSPLQAASPGSGHYSIVYWPTMSIAERSMLSDTLRTKGKAEQNSVAAVCRDEAAITSDFTEPFGRHSTRQTRVK
jgi:hypothetical protein